MQVLFVSRKVDNQNTVTTLNKNIIIIKISSISTSANIEFIFGSFIFLNGLLKHISTLKNYERLIRTMPLHSILTYDNFKNWSVSR